MRKLWIVLSIMAWPQMGWGASIFLNGVNIDGVTGQTFDGCRVEIDAYGNVHITAKGYAVQSGETGKPAPGPAPSVVSPPTTGGSPSRRYWLVTEKAAPGMTQYDVDLFINSKWVRKFLDSEEHVIMEITKYLQTGSNKVSFMAKKNVGDARRSSSPQHYFRIIVGEGDAGGRNVMINKKAIDYKRTALELKDYQDDFNMMAQ